MMTTVIAAALEHVEKADEIGIGVGVRLLDRMAHAGLGREMHDLRETMLRKQPRDRLAIGKIGLDEGEARVVLQQRQARPLQCRIVIGVEIVEPDAGAAFAQELPGDVKTYET